MKACDTKVTVQNAAAEGMSSDCYGYLAIQTCGEDLIK